MQFQKIICFKTSIYIQNTMVVVYFLSVPSEIVDHLSTSDVTTKEGTTIILTCNVTGIPLPAVTWRRQAPPTSSFNSHGRQMCRLASDNRPSKNSSHNYLNLSGNSYILVYDLFSLYFSL